MVGVFRNDIQHVLSADNSIVITKSIDNGYSWSVPVLVTNDAGWNYSNWSGGYTHTCKLIVIGEKSTTPAVTTIDTRLNFMITSIDDGTTWSAEGTFDVSGTHVDKTYVISKVIRLSNGTIGVAHAGKGYSAYVAANDVIDYREILFATSADDGITWTHNVIYSRTGNFAAMAYYCPNEPTVCELEGGNLVCLARDESFYNLPAVVVVVPTGALVVGEAYHVRNDNDTIAAGDYVTHNTIDYTPGETFLAANANYVAAGDAKIYAGSAGFVQFVSPDYGVTWTEVGFTTFARAISETKRQVNINRVTVNGIPMVACYYGLAYEQTVNVIYGIGSELMDTTTGHLAWDTDTITTIATGGYKNIGTPTAIQEFEGKYGVHGIVHVSDETSANAGHVDLYTVPSEVVGKIIASTLQA